MLRPATSDLLGPDSNRYSLVIATAKIARQISEEAQEKKIPLEDKPVSLAVELLSKHKYTFYPPREDHQTEAVALSDEKKAEAPAELLSGDDISADQQEMQTEE
ncbi:MAG: DNA-directed RNA polymerase subunit omega [Clostridia bacterium]|nr:DNA-directed RNA polymerase subunit omega [Clostridia bacterium]